MAKVEKRIHRRIAIGAVIVALALLAWLLGFGRAGFSGAALP